ncbi:MAG TPA: 50S ribosomal protein L24 [bacterium]|nr:50S ribosomal protein L24 [bacterium]
MIKRGLAKERRKKFLVKKNDTVLVITGDERGKRGRVLHVLHKRNSILIENVNFIRRSTKAKRVDQKGGIVEKEGPVRISNVMLVCANCDRPTRIAHKTLSDGRKVRVCKKCGEMI